MEYRNSPPVPSKFRPRPLHVVISLMVLAHGAQDARAQTIGNPDFASGTAHWDECTVEVGLAVLYGGPLLGGNVAEVDGNGTATTSDDRVLCQTISGFTAGSTYLLEFDATRRPGLFTPSTVSVTVKMVGTPLSTVVSRSGGYDMQHQQLSFKATATSHQLLITPNFTSAYGMVFDDFALTKQITLPVELLGFEAYAEADRVEVAWSTASETDNAYFEVQRSTDLAQWRVVGTVPGAGNSQQVLHYAIADQAPVMGLSYYRLRQVDTDGGPWVSEAKVVVRDAAGPSLWPDPAVDEVFVSGTGDEGAPLEVFDQLGRPVRVAQQRAGDLTRLAIDALPSGRYYVRSTSGRAFKGAFLKP